MSQYRPTDLTVQPQEDFTRDIERRRLGNRIIKEEGDILQTAMRFFASQRVAMQRHAGNPAWLSQMANRANESAPAR